MSFREQVVLRLPPRPEYEGALWFFWMGDIDGDGRQDILFNAGTFPPKQPVVGHPPRIFLQQPDGSFREAPITGDRRTLVHPREAAIGDFNGDGIRDLIVVGHGYDTWPFPGEPSVLLLGTGNGGFVDRSDWLPWQAAFTHSVAVGDVNKDGFSDIYFGNIWGQNNTPPVLLLGGPNGFRTAPLPRLAGEDALKPGGFAPISSLLGDLNRDGFLDLVVGGRQGAVFYGRDGTVDGHWFHETPTRLPAGLFGPDNTESVDLIAIDLNNDGKMDLLASQHMHIPLGQGRAIQALVQQPDGSFVDATKYYFPDFSYDGFWIQFLKIVDVDGDGFQDIVGEIVDFYNLSRSTFWLNDGTGRFFETFDPARMPVRQPGVPVLDTPGVITRALMMGEGVLTATRYEFDPPAMPHLRGSADTDTHRLSGNRGDWIITFQGADAKLTPIAGGAPVTARAIERFQFDDGILAIDLHGPPGQVFRLYRGVLAREPDPEGLGFWVRGLEAGLPFAEIVRGFVFSEEFRTRFGSPDQPAVVIDALYRNVLGRAPDPEGFANWNAYVAAGGSILDVVPGFTNSLEFIQRVGPDMQGGLWMI